MIGFYNYTVICTYASLISSVIGIVLGAMGNVQAAVICLLVSGFLDAFDGKIASTRTRTPNEKRFGIQLDSLSDVVCFGVLPAMIGYAIGFKGNVWGIAVMAVYVLAALIRLAYFNVMEEERQVQEGGVRKFYEGMPVTISAIIIPLLYIVYKYFFKENAGNLFSIIYAAVMLVCAGAFLLKFSVPKPGLKGILAIVALGILIFILVII